MDCGHLRADADTAGFRCSGGCGGRWVADRAQGRYSPETSRRLACGPELVGRCGGEAFAYEESRPLRGHEAFGPTGGRSLRRVPGGKTGLRDRRDGRRGYEGSTQGRAQERGKRGGQERGPFEPEGDRLPQPGCRSTRRASLETLQE